jgi:predicted Holliday junction resolvase-like endonuclease
MMILNYTLIAIIIFSILFLYIGFYFIKLSISDLYKQIENIINLITEKKQKEWELKRKLEKRKRINERTKNKEHDYKRKPRNEHRNPKNI